MCVLSSLSKSFLLFALLGLSPALNSCAGFPWISPSELEIEIERGLGGPLPDIGNLIPDYTPPEPERPSLLVGGFLGESQEEREWGALLGMVLRWKLAFAPNAHLTLGPVGWNTLQRDLWKPGIPREEAGRNLDSQSLAFHRYGIRNVLVSQISMSDSEFEIESRLVQLPQRKVLWENSFSGPPQEIPATLIQIAEAVFDTLLPDLDEEVRSYVREVNPPNIEVLQEYLAYLKASSGFSSEERFLFSSSG